MNARSWIQTFTGKRFFPLNPFGADVDIRDIAHGLSLLCRFTGQIVRFYSVAEHSYRVSLLVEKWSRAAGLDPLNVALLALWALLHDASEAYLADIASPVKRCPVFDGYREHEKHLQRVIARAFGLDTTEPSEVKRADLDMLALEAAELLRGGPRSDWTLPVRARRRTWFARVVRDRLGWSPRKAERRFLKRYHDLSRRVNL